MKRNILIMPAIALAGAMFIAKPLLAVDVAATQPSTEAEALIHQLGDDDFHIRRSAAEKLKQMGAPAVPALREARKSADPEIHARADELLEQLDHPTSLPLPRPTGGGHHSVSVSIMNGDKTIDVNDPGRTVHIEQTATGITMKVSGQIDGTSVTRNYKAKDAEQLKKENPEAFALYKQYDGSGGVDAIEGQLLMQRQFNVRANGAIIGPNLPPGMIQPPVAPIMPAGNPTLDDLEKLQTRLDEQMKAANVPDARQNEVRDRIKELRETLQAAAVFDKPVDAVIRNYNEHSDALRKELADLKLPDPGDALPPPANSRLGISATEEPAAGEGLTVMHVLAGSRAEKIGLKELDVIQKIAGEPIHSTGALRKAVTDHPVGLTIDVVRDGKPMKLEEAK